MIGEQKEIIIFNKNNLKLYKNDLEKKFSIRSDFGIYLG